ncbi:YadA-like family protein, partial [Acinetobacter sp. AOR43_HL]
GGTVATDNYASSTTETALGSARGTAHTTTLTSGKITAVGGITVTTTGAGTSLDDIDSFTANGVTTTKAANPTAVAAFINAAKKGGNIAVGSYSTALGNSNSASGFNNSAVGFNNTASNGDLNNAFGAYNKNNGAAKNTAVGIGNIINSSAWGTNALGYSNNVSNLYGSAIGTKNTVTVAGGNAIGLNNIVTGGYANAIGTGNTVIGQNGAAVGSGLADYAGNLGPQVVLTPFSYTPTFSSVGGVTTLDGVVIKTSAADWAALSANPSLLTEVNGQSVTAAQATDIINNFKQGGNLALSNRSSVFGINSKAVAAGATAIGLNSVADEANTVSVGRAGAEKRITNVATPTKATDAANKGYVDTKFASVTGGTVATDNYASSTTETALGSARGTAHTTTLTAGKITAVGGITVTTDLATAGISIDDINSFTVGGVITTKAADPAKVAAFINAAKKGGNIAVGQLSSAVGTANIASGNNSSAVGSNNTASSNNSSALGYGNTASNLYSNALGYRNTASNLYSNALGFNNDALGWSSSSVGLGNLTTQFASSAFGFFNAAVAESSTAMGSGINGGVSSRLRTLEEKVENGKLVSVNGVAVTATGNTTATITHVNGVAVDENQKSQFLNILRQGNVAAGQYSSAMGVRNLATGVDSSAFGYGNDATANQSSVFGSNSQATAQGATAIGFNSLANEANTVSVGRSGAEKRITNVADAVNAKDAANKGYVDTALSNFTGNADAVLYDTGTNKATLILAGTSGTKITNLQNATLSDISTDAVTGQQLKATNDVVAGKASQTDLTTGLAAKADKTAFDSLNNKVTDAATGLDSKASTTALTTGLSSTLADAKTYADTGLATKADQTALTTGLSSTLADAKTYADTGLATKADQTALTTGLANTLTDAKGYTDVEVGKLDTKLGTEVGNLNTAITNSANTINTRIDGVDTRIGNEVTTLNTKIGTEVGTLNTRISNEVGTLNTTISGIDGRVTTNTNDIALLKTNTGNLAANAVIYDSATKDTITLAGTNGTKLTGLQDATLDATSKDAVTGKQLHATNTSVTALDGRVTTEVGNLNTAITTSANTINSRIDGVDTTVAALDTRVGNEVTALDGKITTNKNAISTLDGRVTTNTNDIAALQSGLGGISANAVVYDSASKDTITLAGGTNGTKITNLKDATLDANSKDAVTGKQLHATNTNVTTLSDRVTTEVGSLNTAITNSANTINTRIDGVDTRIGNEVATLNTRVDTTNTALVQALGGGAAWNNGVFTNPAFSIQGKAKNTVSDAFIAVDQQLGAIKTSVSDLKTHTDQQAVSNLNDAKNYADQQTTTALNNAKGYTDQKTTSTLNDAKSYADQKAADGKAYTDQQTASTLNSAKNYADQKAADGKAYTDQQTASVLNDAKSYTDQKAASSLSGAKDYTDQQTASALSSANSYTDGKIADVQTQLTASNQFVQVNGVTDAQAASATGENSVAIGTNTVVTGHRSTAVGVGNQVSGNGSGAFGDPNTVSGNASYVVGNDNKVTGDNTFVLGNNVDTQAKNAVVLGNDSVSDRDNTVSVGAKGKERQIIHVADAVEDTDAVNYQQLKAAERSTNSYTNERVNALNSAFNDYRMETEQRFHKVDERFNRQGAMTAAMMNMASSAASVRGQNRVGVGAGFQGQEQAVSIGYQRIINENTSLTIGGAFTKEESSGGVGVGFGW